MSSQIVLNSSHYNENENAFIYKFPIQQTFSKGDKIVFDVDERGISRFYYNGTWVGTIEDPDFAPAFIAIWLSPETSRPAHRDGLLAD